MNRWLSAFLLPAVLAVGACSDCCDDGAYGPYGLSAVEIEVEVYDPVSGGVWENVGVRIVQADQEWSNCTCVSPYVDTYAFTDRTGLAYFSPFAIASYDVGFAVDGSGRAVLGPDYTDDEALVLVEAWAPGFDPVYAEVPLSWDRPYRFVSIPFEAPQP